MTHSPYEAPEMIPEAEFVEAREQLRERRRIVAGFFIVAGFVGMAIIGAVYLSGADSTTQQAENRTLEQIMN